MKHPAKTSLILLLLIQLAVFSCKSVMFASYGWQFSGSESAWLEYVKDYTGQGEITAGNGDVTPYITEKPHPNAGNVPKAMLRALKDNPEKQLENLIALLTGGIDDPFIKVKIIHDWMIYNIAYDIKTYKTGNIPVQSVAATLQTGKAVCSGYASLFQVMSEMAGVPCQVIEGYGRGSNDNPAGGRERITSDHAWNAVKIGDGWYLLDVTWDSNYLWQRRQYSTSWLFSPPQAMVYSHFPDQSAWQLLAPAVTREKFLSYAGFNSDFFMILKGIPEPLLKEYMVRGEFSFTLPRVADGYELSFTFLDAAEYANVEKALASGKNYTYNLEKNKLSRNTWDDHLTVDLLFSKKTTYFLIFDWRKDTGDNSTFKTYLQCGVIRFINESVPGHIFPTREKTVSNVVAPKYGPLRYGTEQTFHFFAPGIDKVYIKDSQKRWEFPALNDKGEFLFTYRVLQKKDYTTHFPGKEYEYTFVDITSASGKRAGRFSSLLRYGLAEKR